MEHSFLGTLVISLLHLLSFTCILVFANDISILNCAGKLVDTTVVVDIASLFVFIPSGPSKSINHNYTSGVSSHVSKYF